VIPKINNRGHSFKGVTAYLIHDKDRAETSERLAWSYTENLPTDDIEKAAKVMAYTAMNAEKLKEESGGSAVGRKPSAGEVWHSSLAWALGEDPSIDHQRETARDYIQKHGLSEHEYMIIGHNDTDHVHAHVVVNLVHPETGKTHDVGLDKRRAQEWAQEYEQEHGLHCQARIDNAEKREQGEITKHQDQKQDYADKITRAYYAADSGKAFVHALKEEGLQLGKARRGDHNYVIVDDKGDIQKLSRQLEIEEKGKLKTAAIKALLSDIDRESIQDGEALAREIKTRDLEAVSELEQRKKEASTAEHARQNRHNEEQARERDQLEQEYFDRDAYQAQQEEAIEAAALEAQKREAPQKKKSRYDYRAKKEQRLQDVDQSRARAAKRREAKSALEADNLRREQDKAAAISAAAFKQQEEKKDWIKPQHRENERVREEIRQAGSFADSLDKVRAAEAVQDKEAARHEKIWGQQERNIAEGIKRGVIEAPEPVEKPETFAALAAQIEKETAADKPEPQKAPSAPQKTFAEMAADIEKETAPEVVPEPQKEPDYQRSFEETAKEYEQPAAPVPEPETPQQSFAEMAQQYENAAGNDNSPAQTQETPQQEQAPAEQGQPSQNTGGLER
jgi:hypothetical protein